MPEEQLDIKDGEEYAIRRQTAEERELIESYDTPSYTIDLDLDDNKIEELTDQVFLEFEALKKERVELKLEDKWKERDRQYDGELTANNKIEFNLHVHETKIKVDAVVRAINEAFLDSDPMFDISPRPETGRNNGFEIAEKQSHFLDYTIDEEVKPENALTSVGYSAVKKFVGIGKISWDYERQRRKREESYDGTQQEPLGVAPNGTPIINNIGLNKFLQAYPDAMNDKRYQGYIKDLMAGKKINIVVEYYDDISNNAKLEYVKLEDFYVRNACKGNEGLKYEHCIVERQHYSYWELQSKEDKGEFIDVNRLFVGKDQIGEGDKTSEDYKTDTYDVLEVTTFFKVKDGDEEVRIKAWFGEDKKVYLGGQIFPYYGFDIDYMAFYVTTNDYGFYGDARSASYDLLDTNLAQDALLNLTLDGVMKRNTVTPIVESGSEIEDMFLDHVWSTGKPLPVDNLTDDIRKAIDFVQYPNMDMQGSLILMEKMKRIGSDVMRVSDLTTGGESAIDPDAPASKTFALLEQSGIGIKDYIRTFLPTFNVFACNILQIYYQMSQEDKQYKVVGKGKAVTGENPFANISREEMVAKTNVQSRAASFAFDKINEKREAMAAYQVVNSDPYAAQQPELRFKALDVLLETFGDRWKAIADNNLLSPEEFKQQQMQIAMQAVMQLMQAAQQQAQTTGVQPDPREVFAQAPDAVTQAQAVSYDPTLAEENKK